MANSKGLATFFKSFDGSNPGYNFSSWYGTGANDYIATQITTANSNWIDGGDVHVILWDGSPSSISHKNETGALITVNRLEIRRSTTTGSGLLCRINHTATDLNDGDSIVYSNIRLTFTTG